MFGPSHTVNPMADAVHTAHSIPMLFVFLMLNISPVQFYRKILLNTNPYHNHNPKK